MPKHKWWCASLFALLGFTSLLFLPPSISRMVVSNDPILRPLAISPGDQEVAVVGVASCFLPSERHAQMWAVIARELQALAANDDNNVSAPISAFSSRTSSATGPREATTTKAGVRDARTKKALLWLWIGDAVYADTMFVPGVWLSSSSREAQQRFAELHSSDYEFFLRHAVDAVDGVWDDHDYNRNNGDGYFTQKDQAREMFLDAMGTPPSSPRRTQKGGIYGLRTVPFFPSFRVYEQRQNSEGETSGGEEKENVVSCAERNNSCEEAFSEKASFRAPSFLHAFCVVMLDVRYSLNLPDAEVLGKEQWAWLEKTFEQLSDFVAESEDDDGNSSGPCGRKTKCETRRENNAHCQRSKKNATKPRRRKSQRPCAVTLVTSGVQFLSQEKPSERWAGYHGGRAARARLIRLIAQKSVQRVVFLTGDVHLSEIFMDVDGGKRTVGYPLLELTTSGMTHSSKRIPLLSRWFLRLFGSPRRKALFLDRNFATISLARKTSEPDGERARKARSAPRSDKSKSSLALRLRVHSLELEDEGFQRGAPSGNAAVSMEVPLEALEGWEKSTEETAMAGCRWEFDSNETSHVLTFVNVLKLASGRLLRDDNVIYLGLFGFPVAVALGMLVGAIVFWRQKTKARENSVKQD